MTVTIVGAQLGDEGKGGIVDVFGEDADVVVRYQGGDNAGHTVVHDGEEFALSLIPSGIVRGKTGVLGNGCVVNPETLFEELDGLAERGLDPSLKLAARAHVILPYHRVLDGLEELAKGDELSAGTTGRGIGPAYEDKVGRRGVRIGDLLDAALLRTRLEYGLSRARRMVESFDADPDAARFEGAFDLEALYERLVGLGERMDAAEMVVNCGEYLEARRADGARLMFEGAQGTLLDIDHGSYPYVTSSSPTAGGAAVGSGLGPGVIGEGSVVGIVKAYTSRVGTGPLPTELGHVEDQTPDGGGDRSEAGSRLATQLRDAGGEYGTVTGRPRRVGWLDLPMLRHACRVNGFTSIVVNHVDTMATFDRIEVGESYSLDGTDRDTVPPTTEQWARCEATYRTFEGWNLEDFGPTMEMDYEGLPANARTYLEYIEAELGVPISAIGVGPKRRETIVRHSPWA